MATCVYTFANGDVVRGKPALKAYLVENLASLLPDRAEAAGFRRTPVQQAVAPVSRQQAAMVERMANGIAGTWSNPPKVEFFTSLQDANIPEAVRTEDAEQRKLGAAGDVEGFYLRGTVYVNQTLKTPEDVVRVMFHEGLGHYGLRGVYGKGLTDVLEQIVALRKPDVLAKSKQYGLDPKDPAAMLKAAEEVLATMAQTKPSTGFVQRSIAAIRAWLRQNVPGMGNLQMSDAEVIERFILPARAFVERGAQAGKDMDAAAAFSRAPAVESNAFKRWFGDSKVVNAEGKPLMVYHGSEADITEFRSPAVSSALPNAQAGIYFTTDQGLASVYAKQQGAVYPVYLNIRNPLDLNSTSRIEGWKGVIARLIAPRLAAKVAREAELRNGLSQSIILPEERDRLEAAGYDGVKSNGVWIAFRPEQVKSATGNTGAFDPTNPDIRFSRAAAPAPTGLTLPEQGLLRRVQAAIQDNMNRVRQVQERIEALIGRDLPAYADYYGAETLRPGRIAARMEDFRKQMTQPLMEKLAKSGHTAEDLGKLLHAMHAQERNEAIAKINPDMPDGGSGMTTAEADAILAQYRTNKTLHALADEARAIARATLDLKRAYGLVDQETYDTLAQVYKHYVPLKGDGEYGPKVKRAMGHDARDEQILENLARDYELATIAGEKNLARQALLQMVLQNPDKELWTVGVPPRGRYVAGAVYSVRENGKEVATFTSQAQVSAFLEGKGAKAANFDVWVNGERVREFVKPLQDNEVMVYVDGKGVRIQIVGDEQLARQLRPLDQGKMGVILETMRGVNRYLSKIYTGYNPAFIIKNTLRDAMTGTINIMGNEGAGTAARAWANYPSAMKALTSYAAQGKTPNTEAGKMLQEYRQYGGKTGASYMSDLEEQGKSLQRMFDDAYGATGYLGDKRYAKAAAVAGRKIVGGMAHTIEVLNQATENGLRLSLYMAMREQGFSPGEAAQAAKSVTVDFDRKGTLSPALGAIFLFFNPAVQGTANALKTLTKGKNKQQAWAALGALALLGVYAAGQGMDEDKDEWLGEDWGNRSRNLILNVGGSRLKVPLSMEFAPFYGLGVALGEVKRGESAMKAAGHIVSSFIDAYFPLQGVFNSESDNPQMDLAMATVPTVLKPFMQSATNRNSFGSQVMPESEFTKDRPDNLKMFKGTKGSAYDQAAQGIAAAGELTGAGRYENDITKVSPETLKMMWRTYTGGLGLFVTDLASLANVGAQGAVELADVPVVKDFVKPGEDVRLIRGRFYDLSKDARTAAAEFKEAKKAGDDEAMDKILDRPEKAELLGLDKLIRRTTEAATQIRDEMLDINQDKALTLAEKRAKLKELEREEEALYRDAIEAFR